VSSPPRPDIVVAAAQVASRRGDVAANVVEHLRLIEAAASAGVTLLVFPELSLTGYELDLASMLQLSIGDPGLKLLREAAARCGMSALVGAPWASGQDVPYLGAFLLWSGPTRGYAKIHVHESEAHAFAAGREPLVLGIGGVPVGFAICADASHASHAATLADLGAELYVASVMKTAEEYPAHAERLAGHAARHRMAVLTANYAGSTGGAVSAGRSALWNEAGSLVVQAVSNDPALVIGRREADVWRGEVIAVG